MMSKTLAKHFTEMMLAKVADHYLGHRPVWCTFFVISCCINNKKQEKENTSLMPSPEEFGIESFLSRLSLVRV